MKVMRYGLLCVPALLAAACSTGPSAPGTEPVAAPDRAATPPAAAARPTTPPPPRREVSEEEIQPLRDAVARDLDDVVAQRNLARLLWEGGDYDTALGHFERAVQIDPNDPVSLGDLGRAYAMLGRPADAAGAFQRMAKIGAASHVAFVEMGELAMQRQDLEAAIRFYSQAIESEPGYVRAYHVLGIAYEEAGRYREAYETYARALQLEPPEEARAALDYVDALYRMGRLDLRMGAVERAAEILAEVVETYPTHPEAHHEYGTALQMLGRQEEAEREFAIHEAQRAGTAAP